MTYKQIVDRIKDIADRHRMIADFGYGNLSDIKANNDGNESADYPYAFLNPTNHNRSGQAITYRFNLILMDMVLDNDYLKIQSECQQYIDDLLGNLRFGYTDQVDLTLNVTLTPFKERFQDVVAGMTATLEIVIPNRLSDCYNVAPQLELYVEATKTVDQLMRPELENSPISFDDIILNTDNTWRIDPPQNFFRPIETGQFKIVVTGQVRRESATGVMPTVFDLFKSTEGLIGEPDTYTWPSDLANGETAPFEATFNTREFEGNGSIFYGIQFPNEPPLETAIDILAGSTIKIYKLS